MQKITKIFVMFFAITMLSMITVSASAYPVSQTASIQPRYVGVDSVISTLYISSSGRADVGGQLEVIPGYTASVTVTLYKDSNPFVQSWSSSGRGSIYVQKSHYVASGHDYYVTLSATIYDRNGKVVDTVIKDSTVVSY